MQNVPLMVLGLLAIATICVFLVVVGGAIFLLWRERHDLTSDHALASRQDRLESQLKNLRDEWESTRSNLDTIIRRGIRLKVLEGRKESEAEATLPDPRPMTRADLLKGAMARAGMARAGQVEKKEVS